MSYQVGVLLIKTPNVCFTKIGIFLNKALTYKSVFYGIDFFLFDNNLH
mgnify:CR=1 FL=1